MPGSWRKEGHRFKRALLFTQQRASTAMLAGLLRTVGQPPDLIWAGSVEQALQTCRTEFPDLFFVDTRDRAQESMELIRLLRRLPMSCRSAPVIVLSDTSTVQALRAAQNAGAHEFLVWPFSTAQLHKRLDAICAPRPWMELANYMGPDRRRFNSAELPAADRRFSAEKSLSPPPSHASDAA